MQAAVKNSVRGSQGSGGGFPDLTHYIFKSARCLFPHQGEETDGRFFTVIL